MELGYRTMAECCSNVIADTPNPSDPVRTLPTASVAVLHMLSASCME